MHVCCPQQKGSTQQVRFCHPSSNHRTCQTCGIWASTGIAIQITGESRAEITRTRWRWKGGNADAFFEQPMIRADVGREGKDKAARDIEYELSYRDHFVELMQRPQVFRSRQQLRLIDLLPQDALSCLEEHLLALRRYE